MDIEIGSHVYKNTDGTVEVDGLPFIEVQLKSPDGPLLVTFVVFDDTGEMIAKVVESTLSFNVARRYSLERSKTSFSLTDQQSGKVVLQADLKEPNRVVIRKAEMLSQKGRSLEISAGDWRIGGSHSTPGETDLNGGSVAIS